MGFEHEVHQGANDSEVGNLTAFNDLLYDDPIILKVSFREMRVVHYRSPYRLAGRHSGTL